MSLLQFLATGAPPPPTYIEDVFSAFTRTGTGASATVTTGVDMTQGYMLWSKERSGATDHAIYDSARGVTLDLVSNTTAAQTTQATGLTAVSATGHTYGALAKVNTNAATYVDWVFRKAAKFFDVVTYTGNGATQTIAHSLGQAPGMVIVKNATSANSNWRVWHRGMTSGNYMNLQTTDAQTTAAAVNQFGNNTITVDPTSTQFTVGSNGSVNNPSDTHVAYLFAHDTASTGLIQCGGFTTDVSGNATVTLGWELQFGMAKASSAISTWVNIDSSRGMTTAGGQCAQLYPNTSAAEATGGGYFHPTATGFTFSGGGASTTWVYLAIRRGPMRQPTVGTQVYQAASRTGTASVIPRWVAGFPVDMAIRQSSIAAPGDWQLGDRLRGVVQVKPNLTEIETAAATLFTFDSMTGYGTLGAVGSDANDFSWMFRRYPGVFDEVCYTGTGLDNTVIYHNLAVSPELIIIKARGAINDWFVAANITVSGYHKGLLQSIYDTADPITYLDNAGLKAQPTVTTVTLNGVSYVNQNTITFVGYLFATLAGISKVFSFTGNGSSQTINCGFTTGARFIMIKRINNSSGDWFVWDSTRGIVAANDPHLSLNTTVAEVTTDDSIDPDNSGFIVNQLAATNINVSSATYIYLAIA